MSGLPGESSTGSVWSAWRVGVCLAAVLWVSGVGERPAFAAGFIAHQRLVHLFDFEDTDDEGQKLGHGHQWPRHWYGIGRSPQVADPNFHRQPLHQELIALEGFPNYTEVRFDDRRAVSGQFSFYLGLDGGNAGGFLEVGALPVVPGSDYLITAEVATKGLVRARAYVVAYFVDAQGRRIDASVRRSEPIRTEGDWQSVAVQLPGDFEDAAWLGLEVRLLQPRPDPDAALGVQQVLLMDVQGKAWFDDIAVWHVPYVEAATQSAVNVVAAPDRPRLGLSVRDQSGQPLVAEVSIYDHARRRVDFMRQRLHGGSPSGWTWTPQLPGYGWYLIDMVVRDEALAEAPDHAEDAGAVLARTITAVLWLGELGELGAADSARFGFIAEGASDARLRLLPELLDVTRLDRLVASIWDRQTTLPTMESRLSVLEGLLEAVTPGRGRPVAASLYPVPRALAEHEAIDSDEPLDVVGGPAEAWSDFLTPVLMRHGQRVQRWHLGAAGESHTFFRPNLEELVAQVSRRLHRMAPDSDLLLPWRLDQQHEARLPSSVGYVMDVPPSISSDHLHGSLAEWRERGAAVHLILRVPGADEMAHDLRVRDFALRMIQAWRSEPASLSIASPWTDGSERRESLVPDPLLGVFVNTAHRLAGRRVLGEVAVGEGLVGYVFDGSAGGMLAVWNRSAPAEAARLEMYLGEAPLEHDVWGNTSPVALVEGRHVLKLDRTPKFITGIDPELAMFRAGFALEPAMIRSTQEPHDRVLRLRNPWSRTISGEFHIVGPEGWNIQPSRHYFSIPAGGDLALPMRLQMPVAEVAGPKALRARFDFTADSRYRIHAEAPMHVGLEDLDFQASVVLSRSREGEAGEQDALVVCVVTNTGEQTRALYVFANLVGHPRQERIVAQLEPGQSVVRRFRFLNAGEDAQQHAIRAGVRETNGPAVLNKLLTPE